MLRAHWTLNGNRLIRTGMSVVLVLFAVLLVGCWQVPNATAPDGIGALVRGFLGATRPTLGRLSIDLGYRPCSSTSIVVEADAEPCDSQPAADPERDRAFRKSAGASLERLRANQRAEALHARALWLLVTGSGNLVWEQAASLLGEALDRAPGDPAILNDLGVVQLELGRRGDARRLLLALDSSRRAAALRPSWPVARWNAALAASALSLQNGARSSWTSVLEGPEIEAAWRIEAKLFSEALAERDLDAEFESQVGEALASTDAAESLVGTYPQRATAYLFERLLPAWAEAWRSHSNVEAEHRLEEAERLAVAVSVVQGDQVASAAVACIRQAPARWAGAAAALGRGRNWLLVNRLDRATESLAAVLRTEPSGFDPFFAWSRAWLGLIAIYSGDHQSAEALLADAERDLDPERHPTLLGRVLWHRGLSLSRRGRDAESVPILRRAEAVFERLRDVPSASSMRLMLSQDLAALGRQDAALRMELEALRGLALRPRSAAFVNVLLSIAESARVQGAQAAALAFAEEAHAWARATDDPINVAQVGEKLATLLVESGQPVAARDVMKAALDASDRIADADHRRRLTADLRLANVFITAAGPLGASLRELDNLIAYYGTVDLQHKVVEALLERAKIERRLGRASAAMASLAHALAPLAAKNRSLPGIGDRLAQSAVVQSVFDALVDLAHQKGDAREALLYAECARLAPYRSLVEPRLGLDDTQSCAALEPILDQSTAGVGGGVRAIAYYSLEDRLLVWTVHDGSVNLADLPLSRKALAHRVDRFLGAIERNDGERIRVLGGDLWTALGGLQVGAEGEVVDLFVVPDGPLARLPFAALTEPTTGRFVVERARVTMGISLIPLAAGSHRGPPAPQLTGRALLVADPAFDPVTVDLQRLDNAAVEVGRISPQLADKTVLLGNDVTRYALARGLADATVFHFAGHAVANPADPFASYLVLAAPGQPPRQELLRADELLTLTMPHLRLAVLSACETAVIDSAVRNASLAGLTIPFLLRGHAAVIASLRSVDDSSTAELMAELYRNLGRGQTPAAALRLAQLTMLGGKDPAMRAPWCWSPFVAFDARLR